MGTGGSLRTQRMGGSIRSFTGSGLSLDLGCDRGKITDMKSSRYVVAGPVMASSGAFKKILCFDDT